MKTFISEYKNHTICGNIIGEYEKIQPLFFLHGAEKSNKELFLPWREKLFKHYNYSSIGFDFIGHGESSGKLAESSLEERTEVASSLINQYTLHKPLILIGVSMSGYTALKLAEIYPVETLVLIVPGVYSKEAYSVPFGKGFSHIIRKDHSWKNSDVFESIQSFTGKLLIISAENDTVIPKEIPETLLKNATQCTKKEHIRIPNASHMVVQYVGETPILLENITQTIHNFITS